LIKSSHSSSPSIDSNSRFSSRVEERDDKGDVDEECEKGEECDDDDECDEGDENGWFG